MERDNIARYKILEGILRLRRFTVAELATETLTNAGTVQKLLDRNKELVAPIGKVRPKGRGGPSTRFELRVERIEALREQLDVLYRLGASAQAQPTDTVLSEEYADNVSMHPLVTDLLAGEGLLLNVFPTAATVAERVECIHAGEITIEGVSAALDDQLGHQVRAGVRTHLSLLKGLVELSKIELQVLKGASLQDVASEVDALPTSFAAVHSDVLGEAGDEIYRQIAKRVSRLVQPPKKTPLHRSREAGAAPYRLSARRQADRRRLQHSLARPDVQITLLGLNGRWVAFEGTEVVAVADSADLAYAGADSRGTSDPLVFLIPDRPRITLL